MGVVDTSRVVVGPVSSEMEGLFSTCAVKAGEVIFLEQYLVHESSVAPDDHIPQIVRLALRIHLENHFEHLLRLGMHPECWTLGVASEDAHWLQKLVETGKISADRMRDAYCLAAAYNVRCLTALHTGIGEISVVDRAVIAPFSCKANHSCEPNAKWWSSSTVEDVRERILGMVAIRDIPEGEEIAYSYAPDQVRDLPNELSMKFDKAESFLALESSSRKSILRTLYGFDCICTLCNRFK
ncbi:SET domain-containing protein-lysine N-methyltransferase [Arenimonas metalli]|uniref:SET domain-containing protein-lysine N-methyltransferase n=1 Tax=Arenimonas metalli TaxID=948077 RepID=UPI0009FD26A6|nr:SET domain-containing protein-lysine N-methyltransferase [Arenimonas metalli]